MAPRGAASGSVGAQADRSSVYNFLARYGGAPGSPRKPSSPGGAADPITVPSTKLVYREDGRCCEYVGLEAVAVDLSGDNPFQEVMAAYYHACRQRNTRCTSLNE